MGGETESNISGWTTDTLKALLDERARLTRDIAEERDRRYKEVAEEREKALKIKDTADRDALGLAREIQVYKDEKANELREQINRERLLYATKDDVKGSADKIEAAIKPLAEYVSGQQGGSKGMRDMWGWFVAAILLIVSVWPYINKGTP